MTTPLPDPPNAQERINSLRAALNQIAYSRWSTEPPGQFVEVLQKMARDALINYRHTFSEWRSAVYISKADADDWLRSRGAIIEALEKAGLCLWSNAEGFWIAPAPALPVAWQQTTADGEPLWNEDTFSATPRQFAYSRPLYANPVQATQAPADDVSVPSFETWLRSVCICAPPEDAHELARCAWQEAVKQERAGRPTVPPTPEGMPEPMSTLRRASLDELEAVVIAYGKECAAQARAQALKDAAQECDAQAREPECPERAEYCAEAVRALAQKVEV